MGPALHGMFAAVVAIAVIAGLVTGQWNPAIGLGIAWAFLAVLDLVFPD